MAFSIETSGLTKRFGNITALDNILLKVEQGEFFGLLGPNGAGKTTLIRVLATLIKPTSGSASVMGIDVVKEKDEVRKKIGVAPQAMTSDLDLTAMENMDLYGRFYGIPKKERHERIGYLLDQVGLTERKDDLVATYSGGMRRRLEVARSLIHRPSLLILDEPTLGLDPQSRHVVWELLQKLRGGSNLTILITTHYMEEAEALCEKVAIIDYGKIVAMDTVGGLKKMVPEKDVLELHFSGITNDVMAGAISKIPGARVDVVEDGVLRISVEQGGASITITEMIPEILERAKKEGARVTKVFLKELTLEDAFIYFTGRPIREEEAKKVSYLIGAGVPRRWGAR